MEKYITIPTPDNKFIYGVLNEKKKSKTVLLIVHGRPGAPHEAPGLNAARFFPPKGIATFRVALYSHNPNARQFMQSTTHQHGKDIDVVVSFLRKKFDRVFVAGHSWGGPSILFSNTEKVEGIILWDPSINMKAIDSSFKYVPALRAYMTEGTWVDLIPKKMAEESMKYPLEKMIPLFQRIRVPLKFIMAGDGFLKTDAKKVYAALTGEKSYVLIPGARHHFAEEGKENALFRETLSWVKRHS